MTEAKAFKEKFVELYNSGKEIINETTGAVFIAGADEEFRQCWADTPTRKHFPKYWFVSELGNLLSVKADRIQWLNKNKRQQSDKISYKFMHVTDEGSRIRNIEAHNLVGLVWEVTPFGKAKELLQSKGLDAFGVSNRSEDVVQGHHKSGDDADNRPNNIRFLTDKMHMLVGKCPKHDAEEYKKVEYMKDLSCAMCTENTSGVTVMLSGDVYDTETGTWSDIGDSDVFAVKEIYMSPEVAEKLKMAGEFLDKFEGEDSSEE